ncbi:MAG: ribosome assembly RNA-binding protein YhbY [Oceanospirillaceae bacterium]|nr:ribosome assembly RNA-binding protein YhbY [Oceanospirillaceae bacterium]|tara:strand:- start:607 stop:906 length:300 start_codon:yes stop_codon:yes gene_type:complete
MPFTNEQKKAYRTIGHSLKPIVSVASKGLTENVLEELNRALDDHELIKIKIAVGNREARDLVLKSIVTETRADLVQQIGNVALLLRKNPNAKPKLSNLG